VRIAKRRSESARGAAIVLLFAGLGLSCAPSLTPPRESFRVTGTLEDVPEPTPSADESIAAALPTPTAGPGASSLKAKKQQPLQTFPTLHRLPLGVAVYEACSPQLYLFKRCPGRFLGETKLAAAGPFVVEVDTHASAIVVFGFRGFLDPDQEQEACAEAKIPIAEVSKPVTLKLVSGTCSIKLEKRYG
jgi:hypothetical protein